MSKALLGLHKLMGNTKSGEAQARSLRRREVPPLDEGVAFGLPRVQVPVELIEADLALVAEQLAHLDVEGPDDDVDEAEVIGVK